MFHLAIRRPFDSETIAFILFQFALEYAPVHPRVRAQTAPPPGDELALVLIAAGISPFSGSVLLSVAPLAASQLGSVHRKVDSLTMRLEIRVEPADEMAAVGQQQRDLWRRRARCELKNKRTT